VLTLVAVSCYFVVDEPRYHGELSSLTFFGTEIVLVFLLFVAVVLASVKFQRLQFVPPKVGGRRRLDQYLLIVAAFGVFALECFHLVSAVGNQVGGGMMSVLAGGTSVLALAQVSTFAAFLC
jgi:Otopetrin